ncbi:MAG: Hpt domain-containing protein [Eubacteriales bacterium]|nr:Hpt domain-containing protein [Eubacteriales bacterium]
MNQLIKRLHDEGCDTEAAMERMLNDEEFYQECLSSIPLDENFSALKTALEKQDLNAAFEAAHALKGVLANLGLTPMVQKVVEIVEPLRSGNDAGLLLKTEELLKMKDHLAEMLSEH